MKKYITILIVLLFNAIICYSAENAFYFDAIITKNENIDSAKVDFYCCIPNKTLKFNKQGTNYIASFNLFVNFMDTLSNKIGKLEFKRDVVVDKYEKSQGINSEFTLISGSINLSVGNYKTKVILYDNISGKDYDNSRILSVINYQPFNFSTSSILLLSNIEEVNGEYIITPYLSDNVAFLADGYFAFFEVYNGQDSRGVNIITEIVNNDDDKTIYRSIVNKEIPSETMQCYIKIPSNIKYGLGNNTLKIFLTDAINGISDSSMSNTILAAAQRSIRYRTFMNDRILSNLTNSIRQLRYVTTDNQIDSINKGPTDAEKLRLFEAFWKKLDPTPHTEKNEAMEEYYSRIDYANENFKAYQDGWLTDKARVYVVFGPPLNIERTNNSLADNRTFERWTYGNNRTIVFLDVSGFGDFRLYSPSIITDKYSFEY